MLLPALLRATATARAQALVPSTPAMPRPSATSRRRTSRRSPPPPRAATGSTRSSKRCSSPTWASPVPTPAPTHSAAHARRSIRRRPRPWSRWRRSSPACCRSSTRRPGRRTALQLQNQGIEIPFGDLIFQIAGMLDVFDTEVTSETGARANIRQISIVLSLGVATSNSGCNAGVTVQEQGQALDSDGVAAGACPPRVNSELAAIGAAATDAAVDTAGDAIDHRRRHHTGDVDGRQRRQPGDHLPAHQLRGHRLPGPATATAATSAATSAATVRSWWRRRRLRPRWDRHRRSRYAEHDNEHDPARPGAAGRRRQPDERVAGAGRPSAAQLPSTGSDVDTILWGAAILVLLGGCLVLVRRRKPPQEV